MNERRGLDDPIDPNDRYHHHGTLLNNKHLRGHIVEQAVQAMPAYQAGSYDKLAFPLMIAKAHDYVQFLIMRDANLLPIRDTRDGSDKKHADIFRESVRKARFAEPPLEEENLLTRLKAQTFLAISDPEAYLAACQARDQSPRR